MTTPHLLFSCCLLFLIPLLLLLSWTKSVLLCSASRSSEVLHYSTSLHLKSSCPVTYSWGDRSGTVGTQYSRCWMNFLFLQQHNDVYFFFNTFPKDQSWAVNWFFQHISNRDSKIISWLLWKWLLCILFVCKLTYMWKLMGRESICRSCFYFAFFSFGLSYTFSS